MIKALQQKQLCFDDILMVPQHSYVESRSSIALTMELGTNSYLGLPVISAPMDTVCESSMAISMAKNGGLGIIHRFMPFEKQLKEVSKAAAFGMAVGAAIGAKGSIEDQAIKLVGAGACVILIDTANGHSQYAVDAVKRVKDAVLNMAHVMAGNVATAEGFIRLSEAGADSIRVGIGGGSMCNESLTA